MHALEAKTSENRRFWGRVSEELSSVETVWGAPLKGVLVLILKA